MSSPWNLVHPRFAFLLIAGKPLRLVGILLSGLLFLGLAVLAAFGGLVVLGRYGIGPLIELAAREKEWTSMVLGAAAAAVFAWLTWRSLRKQMRNIVADMPGIEGRIDSLSEEHDYTDGGRGYYMQVMVKGKEYCLPHHLKRILKAGMRIKIVLWAGTQEVRAVWMAW